MKPNNSTYAKNYAVPTISTLLIHQNIRSMRTNFNSFLAHLNAHNFNANFIVLTEIWLCDYELSNYNIPGYEPYPNCNNSYSSGGVVVYIKKDYECEVVKISLISADILKISCQICREKFTILCVYRLHENNLNKNVFIEQLNTLLKDVKTAHLLVVGDINIDILKSNTDSDNYLVLMSSFGLEPLIMEPTRITDKSQTCIDHIFVRMNSHFVYKLSGEVLDFKITDHCMTNLNIESIQLNNFDKYVPFRETSKIDYSKLVDCLIF